MGLDMYLEVKKELNKFEEVIYWRKANQIHHWFLKNVEEDDEDINNKYCEIKIEKLKELLELIDEVLENPKIAEEELPTSSGFFFGGMDYDDDYFEELKETQEKLSIVIKKIEDVNNNDFNDKSKFYYMASW